MAGARERDDAHAAALAAALSVRAEVLANAARDTAAAIDRDRADAAARHDPSPLAEQLVNAVQGRLEEIVSDTRDLAATLDRFRRLAGPAASPPAPADPPTAAPDPRYAKPLRGEEVDDRPGGVRISDGVRLLATQMWVAGASATEIAARLQDDFGVTEADAAVGELFGGGARPEAQGEGVNADERPR